MGGRSFFHILVKWGGHYKMLWGVKNFKNCKVTPPTIKHKRVETYFLFLIIFPCYGIYIFKIEKFLNSKQRAKKQAIQTSRDMPR